VVFLIKEIAIARLFGFSLFLWFGIMALIFLLATLIIGFLSFRGKSPAPFSWHQKLAIITIILALLHVILAISVFIFSF
jgi:DMSO/TMAO reductase YedYZ heme-binding membrane subunit